ncbi:hypothetical protein ACWEKS_38235, partial [Nocardia sp. NPDC004711]
AVAYLQSQPTQKEHQPAQHHSPHQPHSVRSSYGEDSPWETTPPGEVTSAFGEMIGESPEETFGETATESGAAAALAEAFDAHLATLLFSPETEDFAQEELATENYLGESFAGEGELATEFATEYASEYVSESGAQSERDLLAELDDARARLATELSQYTGEGAPVAEIERFVPAVLAIRPLLKIGLQVTRTRGPLINLIAAPLANLIRSMVGRKAIRNISRIIGQDPSPLIARAVVNVGFRALGLEAAEDSGETLAGEALASAVEATVHRVADELTEAEASDPLQVAAAVQRAFAEAAAAYLPDRLLRPELPERETAQEGGFWVMMPRITGPRYRFRKYTRVFPVVIPRQVARAIPWSDGGTLETYLLDRGVTRWPVQTEVDLYETMPGTFPGHFTRDETLPAAEDVVAEEFQPLTPEAAGLLLREPALARGHATLRVDIGTAGSHRLVPGRRYFRIRVGKLPGRRPRRPRRRTTIHWDPHTKRLRVAIRLSDHLARTLHTKLTGTGPGAKRDLPAVLSALRAVVMPARLRQRLVHRLLRSSVVRDQRSAERLAAAIAAATTVGLSTFLTQRSNRLAGAMADSAEGVTIAVTFTGVAGNPMQPLMPVVTVTGGWQGV